MRKKLTDRFLQTVEAPQAGRIEIGDTDAPGLFLRVTKAGAMSWCVRYCPKGGVQKRATVGVYRTPSISAPVVSLAEARKRAKDIAGQAAQGIDIIASEASARAAATVASRTFGDVAAEYLEKHCKPNQRRWKLTERMFDMHVLPTLGKKPLAKLRRADIIQLLDDLKSKDGLTTQVNRIHAQIKAALNFAVEREYLDANPAAAVKKQFKGETPRARVLSDDEIRAISHAAASLREPSRSMVQMMILTGQRRDEIRCLAWSELDLASGEWSLPAARNKAKRDHVIPLSPDVVDLLTALKKDGAAFVFSTDGTKPYAGQKRLKEILDRESGVEGWTFHDIRRSVASGMAALHIPHEVIGRVLNHSRRDVTAVHYNRHSYMPEKRNALETWARHVAFVVSEARKADNVLKMQRAAG